MTVQQRVREGGIRESKICMCMCACIYDVCVERVEEGENHAWSGCDLECE